MIPGDKVLEILKLALAEGVLSISDVLRAVKPKGRATPELPEFVFPGSGITVKVRKLGPFTIEAISTAARSRREKEETPAPKPPLAQVNYGTPEEPDYRWEENPADPDYKRALAKHEEESGQAEGLAIADTIIRSAVVAELDETALQEISVMREFLVSIGTPAEIVEKMTDHEVYVKHVCIKSTKDLSSLQDFVIGESIPTEAVVQEEERSFKSDVPETTHRAVPNATVGDSLQNGTGLGVRGPVVGDIH